MGPNAEMSIKERDCAVLRGLTGRSVQALEFVCGVFQLYLCVWRYIKDDDIFLKFIMYNRSATVRLIEDEILSLGKPSFLFCF